MIDFVAKGGVLMLPILFCSVLALAIILERFMSLRRSRIMRLDVLRRVEELLREKRVGEASTLCRRNSSSMTRLLQAAILNHERTKEEIKEIVEDTGRHEIPTLERYLNILGTIAAISPLLGLLGTVTGMIRVFNVISVKGVGHPSQLAGGIGEALITTATGLVVAIPALVFYNYFANKADTLVLEMEKYSFRMVEILKH